MSAYTDFILKVHFWPKKVYILIKVFDYVFPNTSLISINFNQNYQKKFGYFPTKHPQNFRDEALKIEEITKQEIPSRKMQCQFSFKSLAGSKKTLY